MLAIGSLALNIGIAVVGATMGIAKIKDAVRDAMDEHRDEFDAKIEQLGRNFGETAAAIREKVHQVEVWARDEFVRKQSFEGAVSRMEKAVDDKFNGIIDRLDRMENKIDTKT